jgi:hypothetical protein
VDDHIDLTREETIPLNLKFCAALAQTVTVVAYAEFENLMEIETSSSISAIDEYERNRPTRLRRQSEPRNFQGVFSVQHPTGQTPPTDQQCRSSSKPGSHWIAIFIDSKGRGEYFDSFWRKPTALFEDYMNKNCNRWIFNTRQLQSIVSSYCGFYCCFYCMLRCRGFDLTRIVKIFTGDTGFNDSIVRGFVCNDGFATD